MSLLIPDGSPGAAPTPAVSAGLFDALVESSPHAIALYSLETGVVSYVNLGMVTLIGLSRAKLLGVRIRDLLEEIKPTNTGYSGDRLNGQYAVRSPGDRKRTVDVRTELITLDGHAYGQLIAWDVTTEAGEQRKLAYAATHDMLTGLSNEAAALAYLSSSLRHLKSDRVRSVAVIYLDLNGFKRINDTYGHQVGDQILAMAAARLDGVTRTGDLAARLHGDEFVVICTVRNTIHAAHIVNRIRATLREPYKLRDLELRAPASIGVAVAVDPAVNADALVRCADQRMYMDKRLGVRIA
ncbi:MAG: sensor domain-containing diguanylate cyclase [Actinocatenispora sp.]